MKSSLFFFFFIVFTSYAQNVSSSILDHNNISANINNPNSFFDGSNNDGLPGYEIPKGSGRHTIYSAHLSVGAEDINGATYVSSSIYEQTEWTSGWFFGPIANASAYSSTQYYNLYHNSIWEISTNEITEHVQNYEQPNYVIPEAILEWPGNGNTSLGIAHNLAPYVDVNNDGYYTPLEGDYPEIRGDKAVYVIINDQSTNPDDNALGIEVHLMFYQYHTGNYLSNTTFLNTRVFNRSSRDYFNFKESILMDGDIGIYVDDYLGCNSRKNLAYFYNGDMIDESDGGTLGYGENPPCQGLMSLSHDMSSFVVYVSQVPSWDSISGFSNEDTDEDLWNHMNGNNYDGIPFSSGCSPLDSSESGITSLYHFDGNPYTNQGISEIECGTPSGDRRGIFTISENSFPKNTSICADFAFIYDRSGGFLENVNNVINIAGAMRNLYESNFSFPCELTNFNQLPENQNLSFEVYPNPNNGLFNVQFDSDALKKIQIKDSKGRLIDMIETHLNTQVLELNVQSGIYFIEVSSENRIGIKRIIIE